MTLLLNILLPFILGLALTGLLLYAREGISIVRMVIGIFWSMIFFGIIGYLTTLIDALPLRYLLLMLVTIFLGILYLYLAPKGISNWNRSVFLDLFLPGVILMVFGLGSFALAQMYSGNSIYSTSLWTAFPAFLLPALCVYSYDQWVGIPPLRYRTWTYPLYREIPRLHPVDPIKIKMNYTLYPAGLDGPFEGYEVEFPTNVALGDLFHYFIAFHNRQTRNRNAFIQYVEQETPVEWILYRTTVPGGKKIHLDMDKTLPENGVHDGDAIYASSLVPTLI